ncbi:hypothetical protein N6B72_01325 [Chryseobacterium soli]|uniref:hypothetical protein n=1 Tax=Chryseobacterium soli TaxID=445961 RepID=UPI002955197E|nr:hypothetical protein [Chryseobacterium soli]MDV7695548.1 hypothetical protein [Chryseobacterium soli]
MKTKLLCWAGALFLSAHAYSQVGINTPTPSSTLDVRGSVEGNFREITTTDALNPTDYHVSFSGTSNSVLNLPSKSASGGTAADFMGRKYYIKNNSTSSTLNLTAASGQVMRLGSYSANTNTFVLRAGKSVILTAGGANGWDLDGDINFGLVDHNIGEPPYPSSQYIPTGTAFNTIDYTSVTVTVPSSNAKVILYFTGDVMTTSSIGAFGTVRFQIAQTGAASATYGSASLLSWQYANTATMLYYQVDSNYAIVYPISNLAPGTYTFSLQARREVEGGAIGFVAVGGARGRADVFLK